MADLFSEYPVDDDLKHQFITHFNEEYPVAHILNVIMRLSVDDKETPPAKIKARLCTSLHTMSIVPKQSEAMNDLMTQIVKLDQLKKGDDIIRNCIEYAKEANAKYSSKETTLKNFLVFFLVFGRSTYEDKLQKGEIIQCWSTPEPAVRISIGESTEWEELNQLYNPYLQKIKI